MLAKMFILFAIFAIIASANQNPYGNYPSQYGPPGYPQQQQPPQQQQQSQRPVSQSQNQYPYGQPPQQQNQGPPPPGYGQLTTFNRGLFLHLEKEVYKKMLTILNH